MDEHIIMLQMPSDEIMGLIKVGVYALFFDIVDLEPFMMLDAPLINLVLDFASIVHLLI